MNNMEKIATAQSDNARFLNTTVLVTLLVRSEALDFIRKPF
ncbi:MAG: hypothetical protein QGG67_19160 [Gammaproteobacteria bacterium]|nr:hypothetical protein [Gammaproteobacteria bacterium]